MELQANLPEESNTLETLGHPLETKIRLKRREITNSEYKVNQGWIFLSSWLFPISYGHVAPLQEFWLTALLPKLRGGFLNFVITLFHNESWL
ncbi:hypothetical protein SLA2020_165160 [Shorea laevis]